jgi:signal transduction histidine kinase
VRKHSGAKEAGVALRKTGTRLGVTVLDEGCGFELKGVHQNEGLGIRSMEERARALGGKFEIRPESGKGTTLKVWVPLKTNPGHVDC